MSSIEKEKREKKKVSGARFNDWLFLCHENLIRTGQQKYLTSEGASEQIFHRLQ